MYREQMYSSKMYYYVPWCIILNTLCQLVLWIVFIGYMYDIMCLVAHDMYYSLSNSIVDCIYMTYVWLHVRSITVNNIKLQESHDKLAICAAGTSDEVSVELVSDCSKLYNFNVNLKRKEKLGKRRNTLRHNSLLIFIGQDDWLTRLGYRCHA